MIDLTATGYLTTPCRAGGGFRGLFPESPAHPQSADPQSADPDGESRFRTAYSILQSSAELEKLSCRRDDEVIPTTGEFPFIFNYADDPKFRTLTQLEGE